MVRYQRVAAIKTPSPALDNFTPEYRYGQLACWGIAEYHRTPIKVSPRLRQNTVKLSLPSSCEWIRH